MCFAAIIQNQPAKRPVMDKETADKTDSYSEPGSSVFSLCSCAAMMLTHGERGATLVDRHVVPGAVGNSAHRFTHVSQTSKSACFQIIKGSEGHTIKWLSQK